MRSIIFIKGFLFDPHRKPIPQIIMDLYKIGRGVNNLNITNYFQSLMYKKNAGHIDNYFNGELMNEILREDTKRGKHMVLENKIKFAQVMSDNNMPIANYLGKIEGGKIHILTKGDTIVKKLSEAKHQIEALIDNEKVIFIKQTDSLGGNGIFRLENDKEFNIKNIDLTKSYIIEKGIFQHSFLNKINSSSLNSLRVMTYNNDQGEISIPSCFLRVGRKNSYVDNAAAGGIFLDYDLQKNLLGSIAYTHAGSGGHTFIKHPDTGFEFKGVKLPFPDKVRDLTIKAAKLFPELQIIGWDVGYTENGPVIIEGNSNPSLLMMQITQKGLKNNSIYNEIYSELIGFKD